MAKKPKKPKEAKASKAKKQKKGSKTGVKKVKVPKQAGGVLPVVLFFLILEVGALEAGLFFYFKGDLLFEMVHLILGR